MGRDGERVGLVNQLSTPYRSDSWTCSTSLPYSSDPAVDRAEGNLPRLSAPKNFDSFPNEAAGFSQKAREGLLQDVRFVPKADIRRFIRSSRRGRNRQADAEN
jgi:hypothetical protein